MVTQRWHTQNRILKPLVVSGGKTFLGIHELGDTDMDITIKMTEEQSKIVYDLIASHMDLLEDEYYIDPYDPTEGIEENSDKSQEIERRRAVDEYVGLKKVSEEIKASWNKPATPPKFYKRPSDGFWYYLDQYEEDILVCFPEADDEGNILDQPDTETTLYLRDCQSEFENGDTFESIVAEVDPILRGYEFKRKTDRSV